MQREGADSLIERLFPSAYPRTGAATLVWLAALALMVFAACNISAPDVSRKAEWLLLVVTLLAVRWIRHGDPDAWLYLAMLGFLAWMLLLDWWATTQGGEGFDHFSYSRDHLRMFWFLVAGWWLGGRERNVFVFFAIAIVGLFATVAVEGGMRSWERLLSGRRVDFNIHNAEHIGVLSGTLFLGMLAFLWRLVYSDHSRWRRVAMRAGWLVTFALTLGVVFGAQSRQVWLGFAAAAAVAVFCLSLVRWPRLVCYRLWLTLGGVIAAVLFAALLINPFTPMTKKLTREWAAIEQMWEERGQTPLTSATVRLLQWDVAVAAIAERPWLGYGGAARAMVLKRSDLPKRIRGRFGHFHNSYLELWLSYGVLAPLVFVAILGGLAWRIAAAWRRGFLATDFAVFGLSWLAFYAVVNIFESYVAYRTGAYLTLVVGGALYSLTLPARRAASGLTRAPSLPGKREPAEV